MRGKPIRDESSSLRPVPRRTLSLIGIIPEEIVDLARLFETGDRADLVAAIEREAGLPWVHLFEGAWLLDEREARSRGLFDLMWHRRATECDPIVTAPDFSGFEILLDAARNINPDLCRLLEHVDVGRPDNPRRAEGPDWWRAWHAGAGTTTSGWLDLEEVRAISASWGCLCDPDVEEMCLSAMGATYTHPGCWSLLSDLGGFFAQCASESRVVVAESD